MIKGFDQAAFSLQTEGEISEPFETQYGWHILKLDKKFPVAPYEELRPKLETRVKNGSRSAVVERSLALKFSEIYAVQRNGKPLQTLGSLNELNKVTDTLLLIEDKAYTGKEFAAYVSGHPRNATDQLFAQFCDEMLIAYHKEHLEEHNEDFSLTFREYEDGLLLFELLQRMVWDRSEQDSLRMADFFKANRDRYVWKRRGDVTIASCTRKDKAFKVRELMLEGRETGEIKELVNEGTQVHVLFSNARLEEGSSRLPENFEIALGVSEVFEEGESHFVVYRVEEIYDPQPKELYEARGEVVNDFQNHLEELWVADLRASYEVSIDKRNYAKLKKKLSIQ
jgi:peptidyl-prolyl cis-trans isomerase SurA